MKPSSRVKLETMVKWKPEAFITEEQVKVYDAPGEGVVDER